MPHDYFAVLGLSPGRYEPAEIAARFAVLRRRLVAETPGAATHAALEELHTAFRALIDPQSQAEHRAALRRPMDALDAFRGEIRLAVEGGLLRQSCRKALLARGRRIGLSDFQVQLLIAEVQFGDPEAPPLVNPRPEFHTRHAIWPRLAVAGVLAASMFFYLVRLTG